MISKEIKKQGIKSERLAVLDLGTNTFHLLIADIGAGKPEIIYAETIAVKLGEGGINAGTISTKAFKRGINALRSFKEKIDLYQVSLVRSAATSAIRSAANGSDFINQIKLETGIEITIIDGEKEAELIYLGVRQAVRINQKALILDIGGGSVECIICDKNAIVWKKSYPIGAARLMHKFHHSDPISKEEINQLQIYLHESLADLLQKIALHKPKVLIGSAGAFETFAKFQKPEFEPNFTNPSFAFDLEKFTEHAELIIKSTHNERSNMPEIVAVRVDMIVVATILTEYIITNSGIKAFQLSAYSLKEGILFEAAR